MGRLSKRVVLRVVVQTCDGVTGTGRIRVDGKGFDGNRIERRSGNLVSGEGCPHHVRRSGGIRPRDRAIRVEDLLQGPILVEGLRKVSRFLQSRGDGGDQGQRRIEDGPVIVEEVEQLVLDNGAANGAPELVPVVLRYGLSVLIGEKAVGVQRGPLAKIVSAPMQFIGSGFADYVKNRSAVAAVLRRETVRLQLVVRHGASR